MSAFKILTFTATMRTSGAQNNKRQFSHASPFILVDSPIMNTTIKFLVLFLCNYAIQVQCKTYSVKIDTETFVYVVDSRFLSFTVDPKYVFVKTEKYDT